ncbi:hypothetical protein BOTBODRAFT_28130 [Botryobasidium botryosum FD-172 SS1]|uniref:Cytochrome P450 n=1 Tax=Botryobasidium botryosum (strain FD-172 SS1) TaxID=930990 RepID=A0A067MVC2_BOTB1|nr:hypothetical protein BOTBODRAFT_28130 [Botryobasidium botryosum FD-172 SS1]
MKTSKGDAIFSPGVLFLLEILPSLIIPPLALHAVVTLKISPDLPVTLRGLLYLSSPLIYAFAYHTFQSIVNAREARRLGAIPVPLAQGKLPGSIDLLRSFEKDEIEEYCGTPSERLTREYGKIVAIKLLWTNKRVITVEPEHIKSILATDFPNFIKGPTFIKAAESMLGQGVFNSDGDMWKFHRSITRPFFTRDRISDFENFDRHAGAVIEKMKANFDAGAAIDYQDMVARFTLDSAAEFLFGISVDSVASAPLPVPADGITSLASADTNNLVKDFAKAFAETQLHICSRHRLGPLWPLLEFFGDKTAKNMSTLYAFVDPIVKKALQNKRAKKVDAAVGVEETLLAHLVQQTDDAAIIRSELLNILIAGRDTTASTLTFATYALAMYPNILQKLRQEILDTVGTQRQPTFEDVRQMKYLRAVINETLRLFPPVPNDVREAANSTTLATPNGPKFYIPAGSVVMYSVLLMHRDPELWGPDSFEFDPERWIDSRVQQYLVPNPFIFLPFNAGPRICLGQFAYNEVSFFLIRLLQNFDRITLAPEAQPPGSLPPSSWASGGGRRAIERVWPKSHLTLYAEGGLWLRMSSVGDHAAPL